MPIKTFRGLLAHNSQDTIVLHTNDGSMGYRIVKLNIIANQPFTADQWNVLKIYKVPQTTVDEVIDFSDQTLLGCGIIAMDANVGSGYYGMYQEHIIFDGEIFNQDIYITHQDMKGNNKPVNYYIELEQVKLDLNENTVATLKDIRNLS
jgi:archaellum component FlaF (FlaF/FlaG flagellin family)